MTLDELIDVLKLFKKRQESKASPEVLAFYTEDQAKFDKYEVETATQNSGSSGEYIALWLKKKTETGFWRNVDFSESEING